MNPILDIFATVQTNVSPTPVGAATGGQPQGDGLFAQVFADAIAAAPQQTLFPIVGLPVKGLTGPEVAIAMNEQTGIPAVSPAGSTIGEIINQESADIQTKTTAGEAVPVLSQAPAVSAVLEGENSPTGTGVIINRASGTESLDKLIATGIPQEQESALLSRVEAELLSISGQKPNGALISAQVEVSADAAKALTGFEVEVAAKGTSTPSSEELTQNLKPTGKSTTLISHSLKNDLRRAFPSLNIESASGKAHVQVKLTNSNVEAQSNAENPVTNQNVSTANGLPIAAAPQLATTVIASGHAAKSARVTRQPQTAGKTQTPTSAKAVDESVAPVRMEPRVAMRKPVQVALKSQGFDIEKLMSSNGSAKDALAENVAIDKTGSKVAVDKQMQVAIDRSLDLNGTERFKLDIKRGHIEALLKKGEIKLQLQPEHLGNLKIRLTTTPTEVNARMETSSEDAKRAVELSLPQLRESFERAGLKLNSIEVSVNDDSDTRRQHAFHQEWRGRNGGMHSSSDKYGADVPAAAEILQNMNIAYGGALNLVA